MRYASARGVLARAGDAESGPPANQSRKVPDGDAGLGRTNMSLYMETTKISAERTAQEIATLLAQSGASAVLTEYSKDRKISGLAFKLFVGDREVPFSLPVRVDPVFRCLQRKRTATWRIKKEQEDREQGERVAWRQLLRWIQAQLALIDTGMVQTAEVFMPYVQVSPGQTLYERLTANGHLALPAARE
jgi:hypothetical protein